MGKKSSENDSTQILTIREVSNLLKLSKITVYKLAKKGEIPSFRVGNSWRFNKTAIEALINRR